MPSAGEEYSLKLFFREDYCNNKPSYTHRACLGWSGAFTPQPESNSGKNLTPPPRGGEVGGVLQVSSNRFFCGFDQYIKSSLVHARN